jgi:maltose alpha-D-glucosyltransferase / alpha-amylase
MHMNDWWKEAKIYELYIDTFANDIQGLTGRLEYFLELGINTLHILPHYPSPMVDDGYDVSDYRGVRSELGTLDDFRQMIARAHALGIRIIVDLVLNHVSDQHPWFIEACALKTSVTHDFFLWSKEGNLYKKATNMFPDFKESNWIWNKETEEYYYATFYAAQPDLNWDNPAVYDAMIENVTWLCDLGVDGFRLDAAPYLIKREGTDCCGLPETHAIIKRIRAFLDAQYPNVILLAEASQPVEELTKYFGNGDECHLVYHFPLMQELFRALATDDWSRYAAMIEVSQTIPPHCSWATFVRNHDELTLNLLSSSDRSLVVRHFDPEQQYPFRGGDAIAARIATLLCGDKEKILNVFKKLYSVPGTPVMYYGDEIGIQNESYNILLRDTRRMVRGHFDWDKAGHEQKDPSSLFHQVSAVIRQHGVV